MVLILFVHDKREHPTYTACFILLLMDLLIVFRKFCIATVASISCKVSGTNLYGIRVIWWIKYKNSAAKAGAVDEDNDSTQSLTCGCDSEPIRGIEIIMIIYFILCIWTLWVYIYGIAQIHCHYEWVQVIKKLVKLQGHSMHFVRDSLHPFCPNEIS